MNALCPPPALAPAAVDVALHARLRTMLSAEVYAAWFTRLKVLAVDDVAILSLPTPFLVAWLRRHHGDTLRDAVTAVAPTVADFALALRSTGAARATLEAVLAQVVTPEPPLPAVTAPPRLAPFDTSEVVANDKRARVPARQCRIALIQHRVAWHYGMDRAAMLLPRRTADVVRPRQVAMYLAYTLTSRGLHYVAQRFGGRDHTTVLHAARRVAGLAERDPAFAAEVEDLRQVLESRE